MKGWFLPIVILGPFLAFGAETRVGWSELHYWTGERSRVRVDTQDNVRVEGRIVRARNDELVVQVLKSSDHKRIAPGEAVFSLASIRKLAVRRQTSTARRAGTLVGLSIGGILGSALVYFAEEPPSDSTVMNVTLLGTMGAAYCGFIGYVLGTFIDNTWIPVRLDNQAPVRGQEAGGSPQRESAPSSYEAPKADEVPPRYNEPATKISP